jgi:DNA repair photolyase
MKNKVVAVPSVKEPIMRSPGFAKKKLSTYKLDLLALCGFGCRYCSSNAGNYLRLNREKFADLTEAQLGKRAYPASDPSLTMVWTDVLPKLEAQVKRKPATWGQGETLVFSMLTDGFSPNLVDEGVTEAALRLVLDHTAFRIRVLTKNAVVGTDHWIKFFQAYGPERFVVGLSMGTLDASWATRVELGTSPPADRLKATVALQKAGVPTYGMLCPVFPDAMASGDLEKLVAGLNPSACEHFWAEPYNDRANWQQVQAGYRLGSPGHVWFDEVYAQGHKEKWSQYAADLYLRLRIIAECDGWLDKLRYLLYENNITGADTASFQGLEGVLLQSKPKFDGTSQNDHICAVQMSPSGP